MSDIKLHRHISMYDSDVIKTSYEEMRNMSSSIASTDQDIRSLLSYYSKKGSVLFKATSSPKKVNRIRKDLRKPLPPNFVFSTTLLYREIKHKANMGRRGTISIPAKRYNHKVSVSYIVDLSNIEGNNLDAFDFLVHDYISTLHNEDYRYITLNNFVKMIGAKDNRRNYNPSKAYTRRVVHSLIKLQNARFEIFCEEQFETYKLSPGTPNTFTGSAISIAFLSISYGKSEQSVIELHDEPVLLRYSKAIRQLASVDRNLLRLDSYHQTLDRVLIAYYLIRQITYMRSSNKKGYLGNPRSNVVRLDTLIERSKLSMTFDDIVTDSRKRNACVGSAMKILAGFKEKGFIFDFEKKGKKMDISFHIHLKKPHEE